MDDNQNDKLGDVIDSSGITCDQGLVISSPINHPYVSVGSSNGWTMISPTNVFATSPVSTKIKLDGEGADIEVNGQSLTKTLQGIEERLNILRPNHQLEAEWDQLRELGEAYRKLEADLLEKQKAWNLLKQSP